MDCSTRIEQDVLLCDKKAEESGIIEPDEDEMEDLKKQPSLTEPDTSSKSHHHSSADHTDAHVSTTTATNGGGPSPASSMTTTAPSPQASLSSGASSSYVNSQLMTEKTKLSRKIREYNRKTTPVHHIHLRSVSGMHVHVITCVWGICTCMYMYMDMDMCVVVCVVPAF